MSALVMGLWIANVIIDTGGQLAFKAAAIDDASHVGLARWRWMAKRPWLWVGIACYVLEFVLWLTFISLIPLSEGVLLGSINTVAIMLAGRYFFRERLTRMRVIGILLISIGVAVVGVRV
jgi:drug/metabolite transporter (DMT)-like permease